jgi:glycosyltransferase involved in cell wall biosynthesis
MSETEMAICGPVALGPLRPWLHPSSLGKLPQGLGGTPVVDLARAALAVGRRVRLFTLDPAVSTEVVFSGPQLTVFVGPFRERHRARDLFRAERLYLRGAIGRERPPVVHAHWTYEFALGAMESGVPTVVTAHDAPLRVLRLLPTPYRLMRTLMAFEVARQTRFFTAVSHSVAEHFRRYFHCSTPIRVIPNGLLDEWFPARRAPQNAARIVFASVLNGWGELKNGTAMLAAFALVRRAVPDSELLLFGTGHGAGEAAEQWAQPRGLHHGVRFVGAMERGALRQHLASDVDVFVHPSREEAFGMTIAEAMALGLPVIASRSGGAVAEMLEGGACGVLTDVQSPAALAAEMRRLANDPALRARLAAAGTASAQRRFRIDGVLQAYSEICQEASRS